MIGWTSPTHLVLLMLIALCLFGAKRLPEIGRSLGSGMREFKESVTHQALPTTTVSETTERETVD
jgi:sec-independent protein translocase protein TatA